MWIFEPGFDFVDECSPKNGIEILFIYALDRKHSVGFQALPANAVNHPGAEAVRLTSCNAISTGKLFVQIFSQLASEVLEDHDTV